MTIDEFWQSFLLATNKEPSTTYADSYYFCADKQSANALLSLVLAGKKRATTSCLAACEIEGEELSRVGEYSILTDWDGDPACVIETTAVAVLPFNEVTFGICKREGEDDSLETWREGHRRIFTAEGRQLGYEFTETTPVVFEDFEVVHQRMPLSMITACGECCVGCGKKAEGLCEGCIESDGHCKEWAKSGECPVHRCARNHGVQFCGLCAEFPCGGLTQMIHWNPNVVEHLEGLARVYGGQKK